MEKNMQSIKAMLLRNNATDNNDDYISQSEAKLTQILQTASANDDKKIRDCVEYIKSFLSSDDINKRKLQAFCFDFYDPTVKQQQTVERGEQIQQHFFYKRTRYQR